MLSMGLGCASDERNECVRVNLKRTQRAYKSYAYKCREEAMSRPKNLRVGLAALLVALSFLNIRCHKSPTEAEAAKTQVIWSNGSAGAWGGDAVMGAIVIAPGAPLISSVRSAGITDDVTGGTPSLQMISSDTLESLGANSVSLYANLNNLQDASAYQNGHLRFDIRLESAVSNNLSVIEVGTTLPLNSYSQYTGVQLSLSALSTSKFTHVDIPISKLYTSINPVRAVFIIYAGFSTKVTGVANVLTLNDIKWTTD
jgi:hypothetical protein